MKTQELTRTASPPRMGYFVRPMRLEDIGPVSICEQECFPGGWGPTPFQRELQNRSAGYLVACKATDVAAAKDEATMMASETPILAKPMFKRLLDSIKGALSPPPPPHQDYTRHIAGYVGMWFVVDEAHVTAIGTRDMDRRKGIGELLLLASIELSQQRGADMVTLEVRVSNFPAQGLYTKYRFREVGVRKGYYTDNNEDALVMTTPRISTPTYQQRLNELRREHAERWGESVRVIKVATSSTSCPVKVEDPRPSLRQDMS